MIQQEVDRKGQLVRGLRLEYFSITWNVLESVIGIVAGILSGSVALIGFALDSVVESSSAGILIWRLRSERTGTRSAESAEKLAVRLVAAAFFLLAGYVAIRAVTHLVRQIHPEESLIGILLAVVSLIVMPLLARAKRGAARELDSRSLQADSKQTTLCMYMSALLLFGLAANSLFGWWWADPIAGLGIAALAVREGHQLWTTEDFCCV